MAIADVYDALRSRRPYKAPFSHEMAMTIMLDGRGLHFDPDLIDGFERVAEGFAAIAEQYADPDDEAVNDMSVAANH